MNQPATKEPTMDEILSSIRQIIADDDESAAQKVPAAPAAAAKSVASDPAPQPAPVIDPFSDDEEDEIPTLALSPEQIIDPGKPDETDADVSHDPEMEMPSASSVDAPTMVVPDDVAFAQDDDEAAAGTGEAFMPSEEAAAKPADFAKAAPMPDPDLSADLADELLEPTTKAAVASTFAKLNAPRLSPDMPLSAGGQTIEMMIREMMRPMLKEWLEENLPSMVERIVTQEIERVSRGG